MSESTLTEKSLSPEEKKERRLKQIRECQRRRRANAKENGKCSVCAKNPVMPGYKTCKACNDRAKIWQAQHKGDHHG